jgi:hypothetical protein
MSDLENLPPVDPYRAPVVEPTPTVPVTTVASTEYVESVPAGVVPVGDPVPPAGPPPSPPIWTRWWFWVALIAPVLLIVAAIALATHKDDKAVTTTSTTTASTTVASTAASTIPVPTTTIAPPTTAAPAPTTAPAPPATVAPQPTVPPPTAPANPTPTPAPTAPPPVATTPAPATTPPAAPPATSFGDGTFAVGKDVAPGLYVAPGAPSGGTASCTWTRRGGGNASLGTWTGKGHAVVQILPSDASIQTTGCNGFTIVPANEQTTPASQIDEGSWRVGKDIVPGTWTADATAGAACTWTRVKDFLGTPASVITTGTAAPGSTVDVAASDAGFIVQGCSWHVA